MTSKKHYDHQQVEKKWQKYWNENQVFKAEIDTSKPKYYILDMFPYPSGAGLHVGHVTGYTATDIMARYKRQAGYNVLHPMGWDSFGLPAEQYAIRTGTHPRVTTEKSINTYRKQLQSLGFSYDWSREFATSDPNYYKWTQWIFTKLFEKGLAYEAEMLVNYCPDLGTVLSNEEVENGRAKEGGYLIERRPLKQWILKITEYAERLLNDLDDLDWPDYLKKLQRNWIGKSEGATLCFKEEKTLSEIETYTTRPDTLFGISYIALSPEHPLVNKFTTSEQKEAIEKYKSEISCKSDLERTELNKDKSGVWTGSYALHPVTKELLPIWIADYVLMSYGTGAVMGVPCDDQRDFEFCSKFNIKIKPVIEPDVENNPDLIPKGMSKQEAKKQIMQGSLCWGGGKAVMINSAAHDLDINGLSTTAAKAEVIAWLEKNKTGKSTITYKLRDWLFSRQRYWAEPFPILHLEDGTTRVLDINELPLEPPEIENYKPSGDGKSPLAKAENWIHITDSKTGKKAQRETNTMPQWAGSCWYYLRFCDPKNDQKAWDEAAEKYWMPVDLYVGGVEHAVLHLLYARFWHKVLYDCNLVSTNEPFKTLRNQGLVTSKSYKKVRGGYVNYKDVVEKNNKLFDKDSDIEVKELVEKMSKSKLNGVSPDEIIEEVGADALRLYEMFMAPFEKEKLWNYEAISGCKRFLNRFYDLVTSDKLCDTSSEEALRLGHKLVAGVENDIQQMLFNTAIAKMMEFINDFSSLSEYPREVICMAVKALYPFAPHFAEECHVLLGHKPTLSNEPYPSHDKKYLEVSFVTYVVQVNGKVRGKIDLPVNMEKEQLMSKAKAFENVKKYLEGKQIVKEIFVPNKLVNIVVR